MFDSLLCFAELASQCDVHRYISTSLSQLSKIGPKFQLMCVDMIVKCLKLKAQVNHNFGKYT